MKPSPATPSTRARSQPSLSVHECLTYYGSRPQVAKPRTPVDRWGQARDTRDLGELLEHLRPLVTASHASTIIEPFAGLGSGALAARHLGLEYFGSEQDPDRALIAVAKGFVQETDVKASEQRHDSGQTPRVGADSGSHHVRQYAASHVAAALAPLLGSAALARAAMYEDLLHVPTPPSGALTIGRFQDTRPARKGDAPTIFLLCPPFPRLATAGSAPAAKAQTPAAFTALVQDLARWMRRYVRRADVVVAEYFNYLTEFDTASTLAALLAEFGRYTSIVVTSRDTQHTFGYSGFVLIGDTVALEPPPSWFTTIATLRNDPLAVK